jgi:hypothetical protein
MIDFNLLANIIEKHSGVKKEDLISKRRYRHLVEPRMMCSNILKENHIKVSLERIGSVMNINHATVLHHIKTHKVLMTQKNELYKNTYNKIRDEYQKVLMTSGGNLVADLLDKKHRLEKMLDEVNTVLKLIDEKKEYVELNF